MSFLHVSVKYYKKQTKIRETILFKNRKFCDAHIANQPPLPLALWSALSELSLLVHHIILHASNKLPATFFFCSLFIYTVMQ